ncbi:pyridoxamine 5'-phosphate oxidase family protein [Paenibacillus sp. LHD-117]|uniref:pyridoxamine 5'-phosphate oxidase family protein n=1 Tax=Paenibacillus sp. LHD-117 TaxID=3071412 RepID=UPI0027DFD787|nr:pyridoxamine 5'-phosphate oxidase family protein [Paenibacillus sp. LHD-117]MDQ6419004.1 pyridoxamine 5'-phosphate oxidase family protein [Paenibacillus sp. LHD-117]
MFTVRMSKRLCTDETRIETFLKEAQIAFLGLADGEFPYVVPLNFVWTDGSFYFHAAEEGRKMEVIGRNPEACVTVSEAYGTLPHPVPAHTDTAYMSVMAFGRVEPVGDLEEATAAMQAMLDKYAPGFHRERLAKSHVERYRSSMGSKTAVFKLNVRQLTAKENESPRG